MPARAGDDELRGHKIKHGLLLSIDGLHALDVANYVAAHPNSAMARLSSHGVTFSNARTPANSDSFPGLLALVTGGSPISHGLFYDVSYDQSKTSEVAAYLNANANALFIEEVLSGAELRLRFNNPLHDSRTPDIIVQPVYGTIYTTSSKKNAEHGGLSFGDTNVGLIVSNPSLEARSVKTPVATSQVALTLLEALGIDGSQLDAVRKEHTPVLPAIFSDDDQDDQNN